MQYSSRSSGSTKANKYQMVPLRVMCKITSPASRSKSASTWSHCDLIHRPKALSDWAWQMLFLALFLEMEAIKQDYGCLVKMSIPSSPSQLRYVFTSTSAHSVVSDLTILAVSLFPLCTGPLSLVWLSVSICCAKPSVQAVSELNKPDMMNVDVQLFLF